MCMTEGILSCDHWRKRKQKTGHESKFRWMYMCVCVCVCLSEAATGQACVVTLV